MSQTTHSQCVVKIHDREDYKGHISLKWSKDAATTFDLKGTDKWLVSSPINVPADIHEFQIQGSLTWKHYRAGNQASSGNFKRRLVDFTAAIATLRAGESWGKRIDKFVKELVKLEAKHEDRADSPSEWIEANGPVSPDKIRTAEQRLRFALPAEHKQLLQDYGAWSRSDSFSVAADDLDRADKQMITIWGSPASEFASLSTKNKVLYQASVMLFVEAGDGYGALLYHPTSSGGEYYWIHQDNLDEPARLDNREGKPRDYSSAQRWVLANQVLSLYEDAFPDYVFVDRSSPTPIPYELRLEFPEPKKMEAWLNVDWNSFE